jgi:hypothetical protein
MRVDTEKHFNLVLNLKEAEWLAGHLQNPAHYPQGGEEPNIDRNMREQFFSYLKAAINGR